MNAMEDFTNTFLGGIMSGMDMDFFDSDFDLCEGKTQTSLSGNCNNSNNSSGLNVNKVKPKRGTHHDLANYLLEEQGFTTEISAFFKKNASSYSNEGFDVSLLFRQFTKIVERHIEGFLSSKGIDLSSLETILRKENADFGKKQQAQHVGSLGVKKTDRKGAVNAFKIAFLKRLRAETHPVCFPKSEKTLPPEFDISGTWMHTGDDAAMVSVGTNLEKRGFPVYVLRLLKMMFWRFTIKISSEWMKLEGEQKLMHNAAFLYKLDGKSHSMELPQILPFGLQAFPATYQANIDQESKSIKINFECNFENAANSKVLLSRQFVLSSENEKDSMNVFTEFKMIHENGVQDNLGSFYQPFIRILDADSFNFDFDDLLQDGGFI